MSKRKPNKLLEANTAVASYLDNLLQEATEPKTQEELSNRGYATKDNVHVLATPLTKTQLFKEDDLIDIEAEPDVNPRAAIEKTTKEEISDELTEVSQAFTTKETLEFPLQCLMFKVDNILLAIPLIKIGTVVPFGNRLTQLPHSPKHFKGLLTHRETNVRVADSASLLLGERHRRENKEFLPSHLLVFESEDWAISCDELLDVVTLNEEDIKWHTGDQDRLSLGTIKKSLALILNPDSIANKLTGSEALNKQEQ